MRLVCGPVIKTIEISSITLSAYDDICPVCGEKCNGYTVYKTPQSRVCKNNHEWWYEVNEKGQLIEKYPMENI
jgi:hypothetical protein